MTAGPNYRRLTPVYLTDAEVAYLRRGVALGRGDGEAGALLRPVERDELDAKLRRLQEPEHAVTVEADDAGTIWLVCPCGWSVGAWGEDSASPELTPEMAATIAAEHRSNPNTRPPSAPPAPPAPPVPPLIGHPAVDDGPDDDSADTARARDEVEGYDR